MFSSSGKDEDNSDIRFELCGEPCCHWEVGKCKSDTDDVPLNVLVMRFVLEVVKDEHC